jgi:hypothetical protein
VKEGIVRVYLGGEGECEVVYIRERSGNEMLDARLYVRLHLCSQQIPVKANKCIVSYLIMKGGNWGVSGSLFELHIIMYRHVSQICLL